MENHPFCGIGATKLGLETIGMERKEDMQCACHILHSTRETRQPILAKSTTTSRSQAWIWMEHCTTPFLITEDYSC